MFLSTISPSIPRINGSSIAVQVMLIGLLTFMFVGFSDMFYVLTVHNELTRFAKGMALYTLSQGRDFQYAQEHGNAIFDASVVSSGEGEKGWKKYYESYSKLVCPETKCKFTSSPVVRAYGKFDSDGTQISFDYVPAESINPEYSTEGGVYTFYPGTPYVGVLLTAEVYVPGFIMGNVTVKAMGEANLSVLDNTPKPGQLPWE